MFFNLSILFAFACLPVCTKDVENPPSSDSGLFGGLDFAAKETLLQKGEATLKEFQSNGSPCWTQAVSELKSKCSEMTDIDQSILAMKFANCHFEKSAMATYECTNQEMFQSCTNAMKKEDPTSFLVYTEFFTHVTDICYYLQSDLWRKRTAQTISKLSFTTEETVEKLGKSLDNQKLVLNAQQKSLVNQKNILKNEENLEQALKNSTASAKSAFEEMKQQADEQKAIFSSTFDGIFAGVDKLAQLQSMLLGEFISLQSLAFYVITLLTCYLITSAPSTAGARLVLFLSFLLLVFVEKLVVNRAVHSQDINPASNETLHANIWQIRKVFIAVSLFAVGYVASKYQDLNTINNKLLRDIQSQILAIQELEKSKQYKTIASESPTKNQLFMSDLSNTDGVSETSNVLAPVSSTPQKKTAFGSFKEKFTRSPFKSQTSDMHQNYDVIDGIHNLREKSEVPIKRADMLFSDDDDQDVIKSKKTFTKKNFLKSKPKSKRKSKIQESSEVQAVNESQNADTSVSTRYNLRRRSGTPINSSINSFISVSNSAAPPKRNKNRKSMHAPKKKGKGFFSSDEED